MNDNPPTCFVLLAGGESRRMGREKATLELHGQRLIDLAISKYKPQSDHMWLSAASDFNTGLDIISDDPDTPGGPVGALFTIAAQLPILCPGALGFITAPVDAPFSPDNLITRLSAVPGCSVAQGPDRLHPVFGYWRCDIVNSIRTTHDLDARAPSLHWLVRQCDSQIITWPDEDSFRNINTPEDLVAAEAQYKKAGA
ncbi:MAG: molybdenum cofactor guanylyltransferase [Parasphingorhabdus sp.]|uniref:molybdenum cofactor guanylyltransferase n=1 Tax=Parasphingorhabdus sp. TaxID=2709688 RepID=UPI0032976227